MILHDRDDLDLCRDRLIRWILFEARYPVLAMKAWYRLMTLETLPLPARFERDMTHCRYGHEWTVGNTYYYAGSRRCRKCNLAGKREKPVQSEIP